MRHFLLFFVLVPFCPPAAEPSRLESALLDAVRLAHFERVIDFGAGNEEHPAKAPQGAKAQRIAHPPNVDVAVMQFDEAGRLVDCADVLLSRDYPEGVLVPLDPDRGASSVHLLRWDIVRSDGGTFAPDDGRQLTTKGWTNDPPLTDEDDLVPGRDQASLRFMAPYPASLFKSMVAFHVMRMIDAGKISLDADYVYQIAGMKPETRKIRDWVDAMITVSDNHATQALLKLLHDRNEIEPLNQEFRELNLPTLQINGTDPKTGRGWSTDRITLTAWDIARLFRLIDGGPGEFWKDASGRPVTEKILSDASRAYLKQELSEQSFNDCLSTINLTGVKDVRPGIPSRVAERWINPTNGHVVVHSTDYGVDIRPANAQAEVEFLHKTGLTFNYGSDAGIARSLPGQPFRHYIIAFVANLGNRYADESFAASKTFPAFAEVSPIAYTQKIPALGQAVDDAIRQFSSPPPDPGITPKTKLELFDGQTLAGWTFVSKDTNALPEAIWSVTNGVILCQGKPYGYARTLKAYRDYRLHVEWRWPLAPGNSGVFLHLNPPDKVWPCCYEAQLKAGDAGELRLNGGSHIAGLAPNVKSLPRREPTAEKPAGEWNAYDIVCRGNSISLRVNGILQNEAAGTVLESGMIGLQAEGAPVEFRNLTLEPLTDH